MVDAEIRRGLNKISGDVIGAAIEVHRNLGPGLLESVYEEALAYEFDQRRIPYERQVWLPIWYNGVRLRKEFRFDFLVADSVLVDVKSVSALRPIEEAQLLTYLKLSGRSLGLLLNFNVVRLRDGIKRIVC